MINVKKLRKKLKMSKYEFARKIGVSWNTVSFWEKGYWSPSMENEQRIRATFEDAF